MPIFLFVCKEDQTRVRRILRKPPATQPCPECGSEMARDTQGPGLSVMETIDNGIMPRPVERLSEAPRLIAERNAAHDNRSE